MLIVRNLEKEDHKDRVGRLVSVNMHAPLFFFCGVKVEEKKGESMEDNRHHVERGRGPEKPKFAGDTKLEA